MPGKLKRSSGGKGTQSNQLPEQPPSDLDIRSFTLRVCGEVIDQVDDAVAKHLVFRNRNTWIVNAIVKQLEREREDYHEA